MCEITLLALLYALIVQENEKKKKGSRQGLSVRYWYMKMRVQTEKILNIPGNHIAGRSEVEESLLKSKP